MNHILPTSTASKHTTLGPDAFTPEFVKAVRAAASDAPPVTYDGEAFVCGEITLQGDRGHRPQSMDRCSGERARLAVLDL